MIARLIVDVDDSGVRRCDYAEGTVTQRNKAVVRGADSPAVYRRYVQNQAIRLLAANGWKTYEIALALRVSQRWIRDRLKMYREVVAESASLGEDDLD